MRRFLFLCCLLAFLLTSIPARTIAAPAQPRFAFVRDGNLWVWLNGTERQITTGNPVASPRFSHDGRFLAYLQGAGITVIGVEGAGPWSLPAAFVDFAWSPTDDALAVVSAESVSTIAVTPSGLGPAKPVAWGWTGPVAWSPDGQRLAVSRVERGRSHMEGVAYIGVVPRTGDDPQVILRDPFSPTSGRCCGGAVPAAWSHDGQWLALVRPGITASIAADSNEVLVMPAQGGKPWHLGETSHPATWSIWEPARPLLAFVDGAERYVSHRKSLKLAAPTSGDVITLTPAGYADRDPAWAPGGRILAFTRSREGTPANMFDPMPGQAIHQVDVDRPQAKAVPGSEGGFSPFFGRDGSLYWFTGARDERLTLWHEQEPIIRMIGPANNYYGFWNIDRVFAHWEPASPAGAATTSFGLFTPF